MVEAAPAAAFVVTKAEFLLEFLVIALDPPAQLGQIDQPREGDVVRQVGEPVFGRLLLRPAATRSAATPAQFLGPVLSCRPHPHTREREDSWSPSLHAT